MTDPQFMSILDRYLERLTDLEAKTPTPTGAHMLEMIPKMRVMITEGRREKAMRWLGFMQGVFWVSGEYSLDELKAHNRFVPKSGDNLVWADDHPDKADLVRDFGVGPFAVLGVETDGEDGWWLSITKDNGSLAWIDHRQAWESPAGESGTYKAIPPTFHSSWFKRG